VHSHSPYNAAFVHKRSNYLTLESLAKENHRIILSSGGEEEKEASYYEVILDYIFNIAVMAVEEAETPGKNRISEGIIHLLKYSLLFANVGRKPVFGEKNIRKTIAFLKKRKAISNKVDEDNIIGSLGRLSTEEGIVKKHAATGFIFTEDDNFFYGVAAKHSFLEKDSRRDVFLCS